MKTTKKLPTKQLEKYSAVFMQLGLVLTLFIVYVILEHETLQKSLAVSDVDDGPVEIFIPHEMPPVIIKKVPKQKMVKPKIQKPLPNLDIIEKGDNNIIETIPDVITDDDVLELTDIGPTVDEPEDIEDDTHLWRDLEFAPIFKGCEGLSKEDSKACFEEKIKKFVIRRFNPGLAEDLGLHSGKHKIHTQFLIDKNGFITDIKIRAPHKRLEKEVLRIIKKIPQFTPGKQRGTPVKVRYILPIAFRVE